MGGSLFSYCWISYYKIYSIKRITRLQSKSYSTQRVEKERRDFVYHTQMFCYSNELKNELKNGFIYVHKMENECMYVSSRGLLYSCDKFPKDPVSDTNSLEVDDYKNIKENDVVYVITTALPVFVKKVLPTIKCSFVLVTGDSDRSSPNDIFSEIDMSWNMFIDDPRILHWFLQNSDLKHSHPKCTCIPIGLDYHTLKTNTDHAWGPQMSPKMQEEQLIACTDRPTNTDGHKPCMTNVRVYNHSRLSFCNTVNETGLVDFVKADRKTCWMKHSNYNIILSPRGNGLDCHRTWEALALNKVVVVDTPSLSPLFEDLPIIVLSDWKEFSMEFIQREMKKLQMKPFNMQKMTLAYWTSLFRSK